MCAADLRLPGAVLSALLLVGLSVVAGCHKAPSAASERAASGSASASASGASSSSSQSASGGSGSQSTPAAPSGSLLSRLNAIQSGATDKPAAAAAFPDWKPVAADAPNVPVPLVKNLVVETAAAEPLADYESFARVQEITPTQVDVNVSADMPEVQILGVPAPSSGATQEPKLRHVSCVRQIDVADMNKAHSFRERFCGTGATEHYPGTTAIGASTEVLNQLRAAQQVDFSYDPSGLLALLQMFVPQAQDAGTHPGQTPGTTYCKLHRVGTADLAFPVLLNQQPVVLPALLATCKAEDEDAIQIYYLDQPANPLTLALEIGGSRAQVIRITVPPQKEQQASAGGAQMEQTLAEKKPVEIYGIYFDFNSAVIKPESETVLKQIADVMQRNPEWKLSVGGHTDNIGDGSFNAGLSQRRAAAVKSALVTRYGIAADRLSTSGYGASQPIADNKTLEGRARNRRVELQRS